MIITTIGIVLIVFIVVMILCCAGIALSICKIVDIFASELSDDDTLFNREDD